MVIGRHTGLVEAVELLRRKKSHRRTKLDFSLPVHRFVGMDRLLEFRTRQRLSGRYDGEAMDALPLVHAASLEDLLLRQEVVDLTVRVMMCRLRTVLAVLRTAAAARVDDRAEVDMVADTGRTDTVRPRAERIEITVQEPTEIVRARDPSPGDDLVRQCTRVQCLQRCARWLPACACCLCCSGMLSLHLYTLPVAVASVTACWPKTLNTSGRTRFAITAPTTLSAMSPGTARIKQYRNSGHSAIGVPIT